MQVLYLQFLENLKKLQDSQGNNKVDDDETNVIANYDDEFMLTKNLRSVILNEEKPKWVLDFSIPWVSLSYYRMSHGL